MLPLLVGACAQISESFESSNSPERLSGTAAAIDSEDTEFPNLASVPNQPPAVTGAAELEEMRQGLIADRANAQYTDEILLPGGEVSGLGRPVISDGYPIPAEPSAGPLASPAQGTVSVDRVPSGPASVATGSAPPPEPAGDTVAPEAAEIPPSPASDILGPAAEPPIDESPVTEAPVAERSPMTEPGAAGEAPAVGDDAGADGRASGGAEAGTAVDRAAVPAEPEAEIAALPPEEAAEIGTQILFDGGSADLSPAAQSELSAVAERLLRNEATRVELLAYASGGDEAANQARRVSLSRAVAVRRFLIDQGVPSTRMDVRALGDQSREGPADRVDIVVADR